MSKHLTLAPKSTFEIYNKGAEKAEIVIYQEIGENFFGDGLTAKAFSDELKKFENVKELTIRISSPGGSVWDGVAIYNRLKQHKARKIVYVDALAASIASVIALAGDEVIMASESLWMIHLPLCGCFGNRNDFDNVLQRLNDVENQLVAIYQRKTKMDRNTIIQMLEKETWFDAKAALEAGFIDRVEGQSLPIAASALEKPWIHRAPKNLKTSQSVIKAKIKALKNSENYLARK